MKVELVEENGAEWKVCAGVYYSANIPDKLIMTLELARLLDWRLHLVFGDHKTGRVWGNWIGRISRTVQTRPIPVMMNKGWNFGSRAINCFGILNIHFADKSDAGVLYQTNKE